MADCGVDSIAVRTIVALQDAGLSHRVAVGMALAAACGGPLTATPG